MRKSRTPEVSPYALPQKRASRAARWELPFGFLMVLLIANGFAFVVANNDRSWGAMGIALLHGPAMNLLIMLGGLFAGSCTKAKRPDLVPTNFRLIAVLSPIVTAVILSAVIFLLIRRGG